MLLSDPVLLSLVAAVGAAFGALWRKVNGMNQKLLASDARFMRLLVKLSYCPLVGCPFTKWAKEELEEMDVFMDGHGGDTAKLSTAIASSRVPAFGPQPAQPIPTT